MEGDIGVVVLVEDGEAVVPVLVFMSATVPMPFRQRCHAGVKT